MSRHRLESKRDDLPILLANGESVTLAPSHATRGQAQQDTANDISMSNGFPNQKESIRIGGC